MIYYCPFCDYNIWSESQLWGHIGGKHKKPLSLEDRETVFRTRTRDLTPSPEDNDGKL